MKPSFNRRTVSSYYFRKPKLVCTGFILTFLCIRLWMSMLSIYTSGQIDYENDTDEHSASLSQTNGSFASLMRSFPWNAYKNATTRKDLVLIQQYSESLLTNILIPFVTKEPSVPINQSCLAPPLLEAHQISSCSPLTYPRKIGVLLNFGFDVDALEVHLYELDAIVDKFFLMEGLKVHNRYLNRKPLIWDMVKFSPRFAPFQHKIVHFVVDDAAYSRVEQIQDDGALVATSYDKENLQATLRLRKFLDWNMATKYFSPDDLIGIGDTDEIPSREAVNTLKHCAIHGSGVVDVGIWFPMPYADTIFKPDWPVPSHSYTLGDPSYWTLTAAIKLYVELGNKIDNPGRRLGRSKAYILGGMHFSAYPYLPYQLVKSIIQGESELKWISHVSDIGNLYLSSVEAAGDNDDISVDAAAIKIWEELFTGVYKHRIKTVDQFRQMFGDDETEAVVKPPWFYQCNPDRFASYGRKRDMRLNGI